MPLAWNLETQYYNLGDSAEVDAYIYDENNALIPVADISSVVFTVEDPSGVQTQLTGSIVGDGHGYVRFTDTSLVGHYPSIATFTMSAGQVKSSVCSFEVIDPFRPPAPTPDQVIGDLVWQKIEDIFDSDEGGPWLRDMTLNTFSRDKMPEFIAEGLFDINQQNPPTNLTSTYFVSNGNPTQDAPVLVEATYLAVILHLISSYVEQPLPQGAQVVYEDRRDYIQRWTQVYEIEMARYMRWVALFKRKFLGLGHAKGLIFTRAGRMMGPYAPNLYGAGRGYW